MERWLEKLGQFTRFLEQQSFRSLTTNGMVTLFLRFMEEKYDVKKAYFEEKFVKSGKNDFDLYLLNDYMLIKSELRPICETESENAKERVKKYKERVSELNKKIKSENNKYIKGKLKYALSINETLYEEARRQSGKAYIIRKSIQYNGVLPNVMNIFSDAFHYSNLEQYENVDWKLFINFADANPSYAEKMKFIRTNCVDKYLQEYEKYIVNTNVCGIISERFEQDIDLFKRKKIIEEGLLLFKEERWLSFSYVMIPQVEGLFDVLREKLGIKENLNGLVEKVDSINRVKKIIGYGYYAFDFPQIRNEYAHGNVVDENKESAFDILMDISYLSMLIQCEDTNEKLVMKFLESYKEDRGVNNFVCFTTDSFDFRRNIAILENCLQGKYSETINWYNLQEKYDKVIEYVKTEKFQSEIFETGNALYIEKRVKLDNYDKEFLYKELQNDMCKYDEFLHILNSFDLIDKLWYSKYLERKRLLNRIEKKQQNNTRDILRRRRKG